VKKSRRLYCILLPALVSASANAATTIHPMPTTCPAVQRALAEVNSFPHPDNWRVVVVCSPATWAELKLISPALERTDYAFTLRTLRVTFINSQAYDWVPESQMRFVVAHEAGHLVCGCDDEDRADREARKMLRKRSVPEVESPQ
jgi:Zn-dependent protease with chaperone function